MQSVRELEKAGADFIVLPCNTLHSLINEIRKNTHLEVIDLIESVSNKIRKIYKNIGILCTNKTREEKLYDSQLEGIRILYPTNIEQRKVSEIIIRIIRNSSTDEDKLFLNELISKMIGFGAEKIILACTDLANLIKDNSSTLDSTEILIKIILEKMKLSD